MRTVAYLGPEHTNTHLAAQAKFGAHSRYFHEPTIEDVFDAVERRRADYGVVPIENSLEGPVTGTLDRFIDGRDSPVVVAGEIEFRIQHYLVTRPEVKSSSVRAVYSHPQALAQCRRWIQAHLPKRHWLLETSSTSEAVALVASDQRDATRLSGNRIAAIGSRQAARQHGLQAVPIPNDRENKTRFFLLSLRQPGRSARSKTSILLSLKDRPGALYDALAPFKREGINLTKIESRPSKCKAWEYYFFIDAEGHAAQPRLRRVLKELGRQATVLRVLGSYPSAT